MSFIQHDDDISSSNKYFYVFESDENITAQELAKLLPLLIVALKDQNGNVSQFVCSKEIPSALNHVIEALPSDLRKYFNQRSD